MSAPDRISDEAAEAADETAAMQVGDLSKHVKGVLEAAEQAAVDILDEARGEAERRVGEARERAQKLVDERRKRMRELSDELLGQAEAIGSRLEALDEALGKGIERLGAELDRLPEPQQGSAEPSEEGDEDDDEHPTGLRRRFASLRSHQEDEAAEAATEERAQS